MGRDQGGWTQPCLLDMTTAHPSVGSSQFLHLCALASDRSHRSIEMAMCECPMSFHNSHPRHPAHPPITSQLQWRIKTESEPQEHSLHPTIPISMSSFCFPLLFMAVVLCHCVAPLQCHLKCSQSKKKTSRHSNLCGSQSFFWSVREE